MNQVVNSVVRVAIIPARSGSVGLTNKNILPVSNKLLIDYTIDAALQSGLFDKIIISTNIEKLLDRTSTSLIEYHARDAKLCTSEAGMLDVVNWLIKKNSVFDAAHYFCLLQPTSPLRDAKDIIELS